MATEFDSLPLFAPQPGAEMRPEIARFDTRWATDEATGCHNWTGPINRWGYGLSGVKGQTQNAHRWAYILKVGPVPEGMVVELRRTRDEAA